MVQAGKGWETYASCRCVLRRPCERRELSCTIASADMMWNVPRGRLKSFRCRPLTGKGSPRCSLKCGRARNEGEFRFTIARAPCGSERETATTGVDGGGNSRHGAQRRPDSAPGGKRRLIFGAKSKPTTFARSISTTMRHGRPREPATCRCFRPTCGRSAPWNSAVWPRTSSFRSRSAHPVARRSQDERQRRLRNPRAAVDEMTPA